MRWLALFSFLFVLSCKSSDPNPGPASQSAPPPPAPPPATKAPPPPPPPSGGTAEACASTGECDEGERCTTDTGACDRPPGCGPNDICPSVCYGVCEPAPAASNGCKTDADCKLFSDYCTGCDCRALGKDEPPPKCKGKGVQCVADPCMMKRAVCRSGACATASKEETDR